MAYDKQLAQMAAMQNMGQLGSYPPDAYQTPKTITVESAIADLSATVDSLHKSISNLEDKLNAILLPATPPANVGLEKPLPQGSTVRSLIDSISLEARKVQQRISSMTERLDL